MGDIKLREVDPAVQEGEMPEELQLELRMQLKTASKLQLVDEYFTNS